MNHPNPNDAPAASPLISQESSGGSAGKHTPTPWTFRDVSGAGLEICAPVYRVTGVDLPAGMPEAPIMTFQLTAPQNVLVAAERWVQFEPKGWSEMQEANAAFIVKAVNSHEALVKALTDTLCELTACAAQLAARGLPGREGDSVSRAQISARAALTRSE